MNGLRPSSFNVETLEQLTFERSKIWSNFLNNINQLPDEEDVMLSDVSVALANEENDDVSEADDVNHEMNLTEEAEELDIFDDEEVLADITNCGRAMVKYLPQRRPDEQNSVEEEEGDDNDGGKLRELLDQTMPVLNEHKRIWQEAGLERVLNTFDAQKIEEKVGGWLRRNQSGQNVSFAACCTPAAASKSKRRNAYKSDSETDSLHSVDMARYILSSRKNKRPGGGGGTSSSSCMTTMTIKTFRLVQKKHAALREKYASCASDEAHLDELRHRRAQRCRAAGADATAERSAAELLRLANASRGIQRRQRRKQLRKRRSSAATNLSSSSSAASSCCASSDSSDDEAATAAACCTRQDKVTRERAIRARLSNCNHRKHSRQQHQHQLKQRHQPTHSFSSSSSSFMSTRSLRYFGRKLKWLHSDHHDPTLAADDMRPCKRESDCRCCNDVKLCKETRHLADTSTEDWLVENCDTPRKSLAHAAARHEQHKRIKPPKFQAIAPAAAAPVDLQTQQQQIVKVSKREASPEKINRKIPKSKHMPEEKKVNEENNRKLLNTKISKRETAASNCGVNTSAKAAATTIEPVKIKTKSKENTKSKKTAKNTRKADECSETDESFSRKLQLAIEISKKSFEQEQQELQQQQKQQKMPVEKIKPVKTLKAKTARADHNVKTNEKKCPKTTTKATKNTNLPTNNDLIEILSSEDDENRQDEENKQTIRKLIKEDFQNVDDDSDAESVILPSRKNKRPAVCSGTSSSSCMTTMEKDCHNVDDDADANSSPEKPLKPQPKSVKLRKLAKMSQSKSLNSDDTFFTHTRNICNSTAVANDADAAQRQFSIERSKSTKPADVRKSIKRTTAAAAAVSSTNRYDCSTATGSTTASPTSTTTTTSQTNPTTNKDDNDCTVVSSTTDEPQQADSMPPTAPHAVSAHPQKGILLYTPNQRTLVPAHSFIDGNFSITEEHLSGIIGAKPARKFLKYYIGRRRFDTNATVYFRPPAAETARDLNEDTDSEEDELECVGQYGDLYVSFNKDVTPY